MEDFFLNVLTNKVAIQFDVFGLFIEYEVFNYVRSESVVTIKENGR